MKFDLWGLADSQETELRKCVRVYTVVPRFAKNCEKPELNAQEIVNILRVINSKVKKRFGLTWKEKWLESLPFAVKKGSAKDWFIGRASIPLVAISALADFGCEKEIRKIAQHFDYFSSTTGTVAKIPERVSEDLAWLIAAILCDGHVRKDKSQMKFFSNDFRFVKKFERIVRDLFEVAGACRDSKTNGTKPFYECSAQNQPMIRFLKKFCEVPSGKKSDITTVPRIIQEASFKVKKSFLKGVFDTDGGKRSGGLGLTSASKKFRDQVFVLLEQYGIQPAKDEWFNKKYNKRYYGLRFKITPKSRFLCRGAGAGQSDWA